MSNFDLKDNAPDILKKMSYQDRWAWYDGINKQIQNAASEDKPLEMSPDVVKGFSYMVGLKELKYCQGVANHHNAVVAMACAAIETDMEKVKERLEDYLDIAGETTWPMYESADHFFTVRYMPFPETVEEHRENIVKSQVVQARDREKFSVWEKSNKQLISQEQQINRKERQ